MMRNTGNHLNFIKYIFIILLLSSAFRDNGSIKIPLTAVLIICLLLAANDCARDINNRRESLWHYLSLALSIIAAAALKYSINNLAANILLLFYAAEILYIRGKIRLLLLSFHGTLYFVTIILGIGTMKDAELFTVLGTGFLTYFCFISILYLSHAVRKEREETKKLNEELKASNIKLREYALKVEELTAARERERVAQELHDSLGHSLTALSMHLEFAEKIFDTNAKKAKEVILKAREIANESTSSLRTAVSVLKKERNIESLRDAVNELINSFEILGNIKIDLNMDMQPEALNPDIKLCVYKTIRESITNGIKHGKATAFLLDITMQGAYVELTVKDNGTGSDKIISSNGLIGIENRITALGGTVNFGSSINRGFCTEAKIPIYLEEKS